MADAPPIDAGRVIDLLGQRIGELEVENAKLNALVQQLASQQAAPPAE